MFYSFPNYVQIHCDLQCLTSNTLFNSGPSRKLEFGVTVLVPRRREQQQAQRIHVHDAGNRWVASTLIPAPKLEKPIQCFLIITLAMHL